MRSKMVKNIKGNKMTLVMSRLEDKCGIGCKLMSVLYELSQSEETYVVDDSRVEDDGVLIVGDEEINVKGE